MDKSIDASCYLQVELGAKISVPVWPAPSSVSVLGIHASLEGHNIEGLSSSGNSPKAYSSTLARYLITVYLG